MNKVKALNGAIGFVIISLVVQVMVNFFASIYYTLRLENLAQDIANEGDLSLFMEKNSLIITLIAWSITLIIFIIVFAFNKQSLIRVSKLDKPISLLKIAICIICGIGMNMTINNFLSLVNISHLVPEYGEIIKSIVDHNFYLTLVCAGLIGPIGEELLYRGIVLGKLRNGFGVFTAVIMQAFIFGIIHLNVVQSTYGFMLGAIFGYVVIWTGSLYSTIILHIAVNSLSIILSHTKGLAMGYNQMIILAFIGLLLTILGLRILYMDRNESNKNVINFMQ